jgi:hypothetical protein
MKPFMTSAGVTASIISVGLAGLVFASPAQAEPGPFPETLCPFRNVINALGGG